MAYADFPTDAIPEGVTSMTCSLLVTSSDSLGDQTLSGTNMVELTC